MADTYCADWRCPARVSCAHHIGRSGAHTALTIPPPATCCPDRSAEADSCLHYRFDQPKPWFLLGPYGHR